MNRGFNILLRYSKALFGASAQQLLRFIGPVGISMLLIGLGPSDTAAKIVCDDSSMATDAQGERVPVYEWRDTASAPVSIVVAIHGMTLHGGTFDCVGKEFARHHVLTAALDMRGFGRCYFDSTAGHDLREMSYRQSKADLVALFQRLRHRYPGVPVFCMGESVGANLCIWLCSTHPELVDGMILSSPCVKRYLHLSTRAVLETTRGIVLLSKQIVIKPYVEPFLASDPQVTRDYANDGLIRKTLNMDELLLSLFTNIYSLKLAKKVPASIPVLIVEGTEDAMYKPQSVIGLTRKLRARDLYVYWAQGRGHLLLENSRVGPDILDAMTSWIGAHSQGKSGYVATQGEPAPGHY